MKNIFWIFLLLFCVLSQAQTILLDTDYPAVSALKKVADGGSLTQEQKAPTSDSITVASIEELRLAGQMSGRVINMLPGEYVVKDHMPDDPKTIFHFSGSNNEFNFNDVRIIIPTSVLRNMGPGSTHEFATYRIDGSNLIFNGGHFENTGEDRPYKSLAEFEVHGNNISFFGCEIIIRGSSPYGYGDMYGKGSGSAVALYKHSAMSILGDNVWVDGCMFKVFAFGHGIHIHGAQNTVIRNVNMEGALRLTDEIYEETSGPAFDHDFKRMYPDWYEGSDIPKGEMLSLTEDGIRAYLDGTDVNGVSRRTGKITVENCVVDKMRGGITLTISSDGATVTDCVVTRCDHGYSVPSNSVVRNCKVDAAFGPILSIPYSNKKNADIELELISAESVMGTHSFMEISGSNHKIKITATEDMSMYTMPMKIGYVGYRYNETNSTESELQSKHNASAIQLINETSVPVELTKYSSGCTVTSPIAEVVDKGTDNVVQN
ncbi:hypothetical protein [Saccharicrinis sp. 156]|uniref:hypothetical protein n=1 Tax=Saccharicrinis sp. 156 TaxID=3417574 RepID=UPI003D34DBBF